MVVCAKDKDGPCQSNVCVAATGACQLLTSGENTPCNDGDKCTVGDYCTKGLCQPGTNTCFCKDNVDCKGQEDGNACNGTLFCNKASAQCEVHPLTVVTCQTWADTACQKNVCNPKEGKCHYLPVNDGKPCDDGNGCTPNEVCEGGSCGSTTNICECVKDADCAKKEDGDLCNGTLYCDVKKSKCTVNPATVVQCVTDDDPACLRDVCNGKTGKCEAWTLPKDGTSCDDGNACTPADVCAGGKCTATANTCECQQDADCKAKEDGNLCNGTLYCDKAAGKCAVNPATVISCSTAFDEPCLKNQCDPKTGGCGMKPAWQGNQCDGDNACSAGGWCNLGTCEVTSGSVCACQQNDDCAKFDDGDQCTGTMYCDKTGDVPVCKVNPNTIVVCPKANDTACTKNQCKPQTGNCAMTPVAGACDDFNPCTTVDLCYSGKCTGGGPLVCNDGNACTKDACQAGFGCVYQALDVSACDDANPCTSDGCDPGSGCNHGYVSGVCNDNNACTQGDSCKFGVCKGDAVACDDNNACTDDACLSNANGCVYLPNAATCSDGNPCTAKDTCSLGKCVGAGVNGCDDANPCTSDSCSAKVGCLHGFAAGSCDDADPCTLGDGCKEGACQGAAKQCDDGNACTNDACDPKTGCTTTANSAPCSDGNACTSGDACKDGKCGFAKTVACDDGNVCTDDGCDPKVGCATSANTALCNDGNACTTKDGCKGGVCTGNPNCEDGNPCTDDGCDAGKCAYLNNGSACSDGNACTTGDKCALGKCAGTGKLGCDDNNACTDDSCDPGSGCTQVANSAACNDGNACTTNDACKQGLCTGPKKTCDDGKLCTDDSCDVVSGCKATPNSAACDDGSACTTGDACSQGNCAAGKAKDCDDANVCTADSCLASTGQCSNVDGSAKTCDDGNVCTTDGCNKVAGCQHLNNAGACDDNNPCTDKDSCANAKCAPGSALVCTDGKVCTDDACDSKVGCTFTANTKGCDDGESCTINDKCANGKCAGTINCDDNNPCTDDGCAGSKCAYLANSGACDDSNPCTLGEACSGGVCKPAKVTVCDDGNVCTDDYCDSVGGCKTKANDTVPCKIDSACTAVDVCKSGQCLIGSKPRFFNKAYGDGVTGKVGYSLVALPDNGAIVVGNANANAGSDGNALVARLDAAGDVAWEKSVSESNHDFAQDVALAPDGNILVSGFGLNNFGMYLAKYDLKGNKLWTAQAKDGYQGGHAVATRSVDGQVQHVVCGVAWESDIAYARLMYVSPNGSLLPVTKWNPGPSGYSHSTDVECNDIIADDNGGLVWVGWTNDVIDPNPFISGDKKAILDTVDKGWGAYDPTKVRYYGGTGDEAFYAVDKAQGPLPGWFAVGYTTSKGAGKSDGWLVRLNSDFKVVWEATYGDTGDDRYHAVASMPDGGAVVAGSFTAPGQAKPFAYFGRYNAQGVKVWHTGGGNGGDYHELFDVKVLMPSGDLLMAGAFSTGTKQSQFVIRRVSPWGYELCNTNSCGGQYLAACDDNGPGNDNFCTADACNQGGGCAHVAMDKLVCTDGNACTEPDACSLSVCVSGATKVCNDNNPCTTETCDKVKGCVVTPVQDGVTCGSGKVCKGAVCN